MSEFTPQQQREMRAYDVHTGRFDLLPSSERVLNEREEALAAIQRVRELVADYLHKQQVVYDDPTGTSCGTIAYDEAAEDILEALEGNHE